MRDGIVNGRREEPRGAAATTIERAASAPPAGPLPLELALDRLRQATRALAEHTHELRRKHRLRG